MSFSNSHLQKLLKSRKILGLEKSKIYNYSCKVRKSKVKTTDLFLFCQFVVKYLKG